MVPENNSLFTHRAMYFFIAVHISVPSSQSCLAVQRKKILSSTLTISWGAVALQSIVSLRVNAIILYIKLSMLQEDD